MSRFAVSQWLSPFLLCFCSVTLLAGGKRTDLVIDLLSQPAGTTLERPVRLSGKTSVSLLLLNVNPGGSYQISVTLDNAELPAITLRPDQGVDELIGGQKTVGGEKGFSTLGAMSASTEERREGRASGSMFSPFPDTIPEERQYRIPDLLEMSPGQRLTVRVVGPAVGTGEGEGIGTWTTTFDGGSRGSWQISLGFGSPILLDGHRQYLTERDSGRGGYRIAERRSEELFELIPAVFFHWTPTGSRLSDWSWSMTGGLGLDFDEAVIFVGGAVTFNQNITLSVGGVAHQVRRLNPKYEAGQILPIELDAAQLHTEYYRINPFVGVTFRLMSNIFRSGG